jgi:hypothetical protein
MAANRSGNLTGFDDGDIVSRLSEFRKRSEERNGNRADADCDAPHNQ